MTALPRSGPWLALALLALLLDQASKALLRAALDVGGARPVTDFLSLVHLQNTGAAFSLLASGPGALRWAFIALALLAAAGCLLWLGRADGPLARLALALIAAGAVGNAIDRLLFGAVTDFLDFHVGGWHWPAFNLADASICLGAAALLLSEARRRREG